MPNTTQPALIPGLSAIAADYRGLLCDVWGVVHNSYVRTEPACQALVAYRKTGGRVVLVTNAPRPAEIVRRQLDELGVSPEAYDAIVTSGEVTRHALADCGYRRVLNIGPERDIGLYEGLDVDLVDEAKAEIVCCTGLFDDFTETPADYEERMQRWAKRGLSMICANPDIVVERGDRLVFCAGALAKRYEEIGGNTVVAGKPHAPIYDEAIDRLSNLAGRTMRKAEILAIGDGIHTDMSGAFGQGIDALFITNGIHAKDWKDPEQPADSEVGDLLARHHVGARARMARLAW